MLTEICRFWSCFAARQGHKRDQKPRSRNPGSPNQESKKARKPESHKQETRKLQERTLTNLQIDSVSSGGGARARTDKFRTVNGCENPKRFMINMTQKELLCLDHDYALCKSSRIRVLQHSEYWIEHLPMTMYCVQSSVLAIYKHSEYWGI
eukprot:gene20149-biopygen6543